MISIKELKVLASDRNKEFRDLFKMLKRKKPKNLDDVVHEFHQQAFNHIDCLECANCCKTLSPAITDRDVLRMASALKMKPSAFTEKYLHLDEENDYVFNQTPCPFLLPDNYCSIYESRPKACRDYPHTDRKRFVQILDLSLKNTFTCPVVYEVAENLRKEYRR